MYILQPTPTREEPGDDVVKRRESADLLEMEITLQFIDRDDERKSVYLRRLVAVAKLSSSDLDVDAQCLFVEVGKPINHSVWIALH